MIRRIKAMAWKEYLHIIRDFRTLYLAIIMPIVMILLFGYAINFDVDHIKLGVCDEDRSPQSREFISKVQAGDWFQLVLNVNTQEELESALQTGKIKIGVIIPINFRKSILKGANTTIGAIIDGSDNNSATTGFNYLQLFFQQYRAGLLEDYLNRNGISLPARPEPLPYILFNSELKSRYFMLPGIIVLIIAIMAAMLTSLTVAKEWERGTMEQLISTPVRSHEIIIGKLLPYIGISILQTILAVSMAVGVFHIPFEGSIISLLLTSTLFAIGTLGLGLMVSSVLKSQLPAIQVALLASMLPSLFLSNFVFPIDSMPPVVRLITYIIPAKYFLVMLRTIFLKGTGFIAYIPETIFLFLFCIFIITVASKKTAKRIL